MRQASIILLSLFLMLVFCGGGVLLAGDTGKISGKVTTGDARQPVVGANIMLRGTTLGATTDPNGTYYILNIPPGRYSVRVSCLGFETIVKVGVEVRTDQTTGVDFEVGESAVAMGEITVTAEQPLVEKDRTATRQTFSTEEINAMPIDNLSGIMEVQAGVLTLEPMERAAVVEHNPGDGLHMRGGRENETAFLIDGVRVDNPLWGGSTYAQGTSGTSIQEMSTMLGTFNAEYGGKMSGVVSLVTKEGGEQISGDFRGYTDNFGLSDYNRNTYHSDLTLSGPVPFVSDVTFFADVQWGTTDGRFRGYLIPNFTDLLGKVPMEDVNGNPLGEAVPVDWRDEWNAFGKLTWRIMPSLKLSASYVNGRTKQAKYEHEYKYLPYSMPWTDTGEEGVTARLTHQLSPEVFYEIFGSFRQSDFFLGVNKVREKRILFESGDTEDIYGFAYRGGYQNYWVDEATTRQFGGSITAQVTPIHLVKAGVDFRFLSLFHRWDNAWTTPVYEINVGVDGQGNPIKQTYENHKTYAHSSPRELAAYLQDKIEFESIGLIVNVGLRWEQWKIPHNYMANPEEPMTTVLFPSWPKNTWSPRLGISYPISDAAAFHCSYGHFYQFPPYKDLLANINEKGPNPDRPNLQDIGIAIFNPNMKPELSVTYEAGVQAKLQEDASLSVTVFYRELSDLIGVTWVKSAGYVLYDNVDFGNSKGVEFTLVKRFSKSISARINYAISQTLISSSSPITAAQAIGSPLAYRTFLANWDRTHDLSAVVTADLPWRVKMSVTGQLRSGKPYSVLAEQPNTERMPWYRNINLRVSKGLDLFGLRQSVFVQVQNLLDTHNIYSLYPDTGLWDDDGDPSTPYAHDANPKRISDGRRILVGVGFSF